MAANYYSDKYPHVLVIGRVPGDDGDCFSLYEDTTLYDATLAFADELYVDEDPELRINNVRETGSPLGVLITAMFVSDTLIRYRGVR